jgi:hypothetical protein
VLDTFAVRRLLRCLMLGSSVVVIDCGRAGMLVERRVGEQRLRAVWEVLDGASVTAVARRSRGVGAERGARVSRQSVHV